MSREQAEAKLKAATATAQLLEDLVEIERLTRGDAGHYSAQEVRDLKAKLEKAARELQGAKRNLERLTKGRPVHP